MTTQSDVMAACTCTEDSPLCDAHRANRNAIAASYRSESPTALDARDAADRDDYGPNPGDLEPLTMAESEDRIREALKVVSAIPPGTARFVQNLARLSPVFVDDNPTTYGPDPRDYSEGTPSPAERSLVWANYERRFARKES